MAICGAESRANVAVNLWGPLMKISFVVPAYNEEVLLRKSLPAILAEIERVGCAAEIIVVNNASTDATKEVAESFPGVRVVDEPRKGLVQARWSGFIASKAPLVANIDADTIIPPGWLSQVLAQFAAEPGLVGLSGPYTYYGVPQRVNWVVGAYYRAAFLAYLINRHVLRVGSMLQGGNFVVSREAMRKIGSNAANFSFYGEDTDLACRLSKVGGVKFSFKLPAQSSGRRLVGEGVFTIGVRYTMNFFWTTFLKRPFTETWEDIREEPHPAAGPSAD
jgi:glycosyltransferase involved in cell wall biosynthesis